MSFQDFTSSIITTFSPLFDTSILFPKGFWEPGWGSIYKGFFGTGSFASGAVASASFGPSPTAPYSTWSTGLDYANGTKWQTGVHITLGEHVVLGNELRTAVASNSLNGTSSSLLGSSVIVCGAKTSITGVNITIAGPTITITGSGSIAGLDISACTGKKSFDISHPSKENHRLRYICAEGPSADVFVRGKLKGSNVIELPDYWKDLVDEESITANLTPIGQYQELFVAKIEGTKIHIRNNSAGAIHCSYIVYGERKDTSRNIPEYEGNSPADYPGDNREYIINGGRNY